MSGCMMIFRIKNIIKKLNIILILIIQENRISMRLIWKKLGESF